MLQVAFLLEGWNSLNPLSIHFNYTLDASNLPKLVLESCLELRIAELQGTGDTLEPLILQRQKTDL